MQNKTNIERIIAKIDNDFNPDNSDWIPRVGAWCIDAMSMLKVLRKEKKKIKLLVKDRIVYSKCPIDKDDFKLYDSNGCEIEKADSGTGCCNSPSTGEETKTAEQSGAYYDIGKTTGVVINDNVIEDVVHAETVTTKDYPSRYNVQHFTYGNNKSVRNYVYVDCNKLELNFDADYVYLEQEAIATQKSNIYGCELPIIPNNGLLIEAIAYYCMYKMLCRGYKHPVFNLGASQYGTNPYFEWNKLKDEAKRSVIIDNQGEVIDDGGIWQNSFFNFTFNSKG